MRLRRDQWCVKPIEMSVAASVIEKYHYSRGCPNTRVYTHGLFIKDDTTCLGAAWWLPPIKNAATATYPENWRGVLSLSRLCVLPSVPKNAASFLLAGSMRLIDRNRWPCFVTYADTWRGHTGGIYKATNWEYCGETKPYPVYTLNGRQISKKYGAKNRTKSDLDAMGCVFEGNFAKHKFRHIARI